MTIILVAAGFFALALAVVFLFRSAVTADDELDRRWEEVVRQRSRRGDPPSAPRDAERTASRDSGGQTTPRSPGGSA
ncbi:hypothetical protein [Candidatus Palauibacter sp.]|uniref:hypothetical protein n=1 Tax=Candidatus Palauibacter sp. TaxID=3101350 RepID=UPI003B01B605